MEVENGASAGGDEVDADIIAKTCLLGGFSEANETRSILSSLPEVHGDQRTTEHVTQRFLGKVVLTNRITVPTITHVLFTTLYPSV